MTEVPKIVYDRLRDASLDRALPGQEAPERSHPSADLLTAFVEQALSATERDGVLDHLSLCEGCRDVIALALPASEIPVETNTTEAVPRQVMATRSWLSALTVPSLRWAAAAAGVAIIAATLVLRPVNMNRGKITSTNQVAATASPASRRATASSPANQSVATLETDQAPTPEMHPSKKFEPGRGAKPTTQANSGMTLAVTKLSAAPAKQGANETVEVAAEPSAIQATTSPAPEDALMARNDAPPVIKSKPVVGTEASQPQNNTSASPSPPLPLQSRNMTARATAPASLATANPIATNVTWAITAGVLQRSLDGGVTWQNAMRADQPLLCSASREQDVWTGGQAGVLFHSADGGLTWVQVQPSIKTRQLTFDITHIELRGRLEIAVSGASNEIWHSADGGKTWDKN
jgi:hypothetical protein